MPFKAIPHLSPGMRDVYPRAAAIWPKTWYHLYLSLFEVADQTVPGLCDYIEERFSPAEAFVHIWHAETIRGAPVNDSVLAIVTACVFLLFTAVVSVIGRVLAVSQDFSTVSFAHISICSSSV